MCCTSHRLKTRQRRVNTAVRDNRPRAPRNQLLLFTALSEQAQVDMWSAVNRKNLRDLVYTAERATCEPFSFSLGASLFGGVPGSKFRRDPHDRQPDQWPEQCRSPERERGGIEAADQQAPGQWEKREKHIVSRVRADLGKQKGD